MASILVFLFRAVGDPKWDTCLEVVASLLFLRKQAGVQPFAQFLSCLVSSETPRHPVHFFSVQSNSSRFSPKLVLCRRRTPRALHKSSDTPDEEQRHMWEYSGFGCRT